MSSTYYDALGQGPSLEAFLAEQDVVLEGARGVGKTRLAQELVSKRVSSGGSSLYLMLHDACSVRDLQRRIAEQVRQRPQPWRRAVQFLDIGAERATPQEAIEDLFVHRQATGTLWLFLDEAQDWIDALPDAERKTAFAWLAGLRERCDVRLVVAGSVSVRTCLRRHGIVLDPRWGTFTVAPLPAQDGRTLFFSVLPNVVDEAGEALAFRESGGLPRWIERIAKQVSADDAREADVLVAIERVISAERFDEERHHVKERLGALAWEVLVAAAQQGASLASIRAGVRAERGKIDEALASLVDSHLLQDASAATFVLPLLARAIRTGRASRS